MTLIGTNTTTQTVENLVGTFGLEIFKYENNNKNKPLSGAVFEIYRDKECTQKVGTTTPTNEQGIAYYKGLSIDKLYDNEEIDINGIYYVSRQKKYYLKEITSPEGYVVSSKPIMTKIGYDYVSESGIYESEAVPNGEGTSIGERAGYYRIEVPSYKNILLPVTGGAGTIIFTIMGLILICSSTYYYLKYKSKRIND